MVERDEDGAFIVTCTSFHGCHSYGKTMTEAMANIEEAIALAIEDAATIDSSNIEFIGFREVAVTV